MPDTLHFVVNVRTLNTTRTTQRRKLSTNVRYASACRQRFAHSTLQEQLNVESHFWEVER